MSSTKSIDSQLKSIERKFARDVKEVLKNSIAPMIIQEEMDVAEELIYKAPYQPKTYKREYTFRDPSMYESSVEANGNQYSVSVDFVALANPELYTPDGKTHLNRKSKHAFDYLLPIIENADYIDFPNAEGEWKEPKPIRETTVNRLMNSGRLNKQLIKELENKGWSLE